MFLFSFFFLFQLRFVEDIAIFSISLQVKFTQDIATEALNLILISIQFLFIFGIVRSVCSIKFQQTVSNNLFFLSMRFYYTCMYTIILSNSIRNSCLYLASLCCEFVTVANNNFYFWNYFLSQQLLHCDETFYFFIPERLQDFLSKKDLLLLFIRQHLEHRL